MKIVARLAKGASVLWMPIGLGQSYNDKMCGCPYIISISIVIIRVRAMKMHLGLVSLSVFDAIKGFMQG